MFHLTQNRSFRRRSSQPSSLIGTEGTKRNTTKANINPEHKGTTAHNKHKKTKAQFGCHVQTQPENGAGPILQLPGPTRAVDHTDCCLSLSKLLTRV